MPPRIHGIERRKPTFIKDWRQFRHLTQDQLAERMETSKASVSRIERGEQPYTQDFLERCALVLATTAVALIDIDPRDQNNIFSYWDRAKPGEKKKLLKAAKQIVSPTPFGLAPELLE